MLGYIPVVCPPHHVTPHRTPRPLPPTAAQHVASSVSARAPQSTFGGYPASLCPAGCGLWHPRSSVWPAAIWGRVTRAWGSRPTWVPQTTGQHVGGWEGCGDWRLSPGIHWERDAGANAKGTIPVVSAVADTRP
jgi:hypothetical protein